MLKALIFDVDGTLAETEDLHRQGFNRAFQALDLPWHWSPEFYAELLKVMGGKERLVHYIERFHPEEAEGLKARMPEIHDLKTRFYGELAQSGGLSLRPGVRRLVEQARDGGVRLAVATTTSRPNIDLLLRLNFPDGAQPFDVIAAGDEAAQKKPAPDIFALAVHRLGIDPSEAIAFEDSAAGIRSALAAGLPVLATRSRYTKSHRLDGAFSAVSDLGEPGAPHEHLQGHAWPDGVVTLDALRTWHAGHLRGAA
ncbi:HAD-IA family hydrolase [Methylorubrum populi]|uniref:Xylulose-1 5-bisphosphate phosphatase CbbY converts this Rubisco inhibiting byproduct to xylulose-5P n=1 Tax=Methylorubrum populi TaxID=223967 RepID=A0A833JA21_9HYPH|nr:HAD-IA family hydrolase [Methylorubrum populi]KAB7787280.1 Xylulose-1 5-bisphosphate phosphatase CbbY converts this Rubisco inhibiting byproduct to xylulose-5P [Methylorubrum populi]